MCIRHDKTPSTRTIQRARSILRAIGELERIDRINWDEQPLGRYSDSDLAKELGVSSVSVLYARRVRHVPAAIPKRSKRVDWDKQPLGQVSDRQLAKSLGVSEPTVASHRKARGISPFNHTDWDKQPLGTVSDYDIAKRLGVRHSAVREARLRRGIAASWMKPKRSSGGYVYFVRSSGLVKVGKTSDLLDRLQSLARTSPIGLTVVAVLRSESAGELEAEIHRELLSYRKHGEWFMDVEQVEQAIRSRADKLVAKDIYFKTIPTHPKGRTKQEREWIESARTPTAENYEM